MGHTVKNILAFEADQALAEELKQRFAQYGCSVEIVDDGNVGLQKARTSQPDLILLTIELPKMNGFSICNKLKKNPELKAIPLIILSSEATEDTFQQHRKLRTHAEDYIRKPFDFDELINKVSSLIQLGVPQAAPVQSSPVEEEEFEVSDDDLELVVEDEVDESPLDGDDVEAFTESAFAALQMEEELDEGPGASSPFETDDRTVAIDRPMEFFEEARQAAPADQAAPEPPPSAPGSGSEPATPGSGPMEAAPESGSAAAAPGSGSMEAAPGSGSGPAVPESEPMEAASGFGSEPAAPIEPSEQQEPAQPPLITEEQHITAVNEVKEEMLATDSGELLRDKQNLEKEVAKLKGAAEQTEAAKQALEVEVDRLKEQAEQAAGDKGQDEENERLKRQNAELSDKVSLLNEQLKKMDKGGAGAVSSREFLDLRELLNKKDREILDFKDQINAKEKASLDQRERLNSLERELTDNKDKTLAVEREIEEYKEKLKAVTDDKALMASKVESLDKRLEGLKGENERLKKEIADEKKEHEQSLKEADEKRQQELEEQAQELAEKAAKDTEAAKKALQQELAASHKSEIDTLEEKSQQDLKDAEERREKDLTDQRLRLEGQSESKEEELQAEHAQQITEVEEKHKAEIEDAARRHSEDRQELQQKKDDEIEQLRREQEAEMSRINDNLAESESALKKRQAEVTQRDDRIEQLEGDLNEQRQRAEEFESDLRKRQQTIEALETTAQQKSDQLTTLEKAKSELESSLEESKNETQTGQAKFESALRWNEHNEQRAVRALEKLSADGEELEKVKRAMAIALTLLTDLPPHEDPGPPPDQSTD